MGELQPNYSFTATTDPIPTYQERDNGNFAEADMGSYAVTNGELFSSGAVDCTMLAAVGQRLSLLGHFVDFGMQGKGDNSLFLAAMDNLRIIQPKLIVLAAAQIDSDLNGEATRRDRAFAEQQVADYSAQSEQAPRVITHWNSGAGCFYMDMFVSNPLKQVLCQEHYS